MGGSEIVDALYELYKRKEVSYEIWEKMNSFHNELVRQKIIKEHPCKSKRKQYKEINFKIWEDMKEEKERSYEEVKTAQADFIIMECKQYINCKHWDSLCKNNLNAIKKCKKTVKLKGLSHFEPKK